MNKLGGLFPKKQIPSNLIDDENPEDDPPPAGGISGKIFSKDNEEKPKDLIANKKK